jgi:phosphatidylinositol kinase/protein kinase (PI-3  family)
LNITKDRTTEEYIDIPTNRNVLKQWFETRNTPDDMLYVHDRFMRSCAGYCVLIYILGLRNGDYNNVCILPTGELIHTDFDMFLRGKRTRIGMYSIFLLL